MKKFAFSAEQIAGLFIGLLGTVAVIRWISQSQTIAELIPGSTRMGLNGPLLFIAAGICCYFALSPRREAPGVRSVWRVCLALLLAVPLAVLTEHVFKINLGIDFVRVPTPPSAEVPHPGRIAPNSCVGFLLAGIAFYLVGLAHRNRSQMRALTACAAAVMAIGLSALIGYFLKLEVLYRIAAFNGMVAPTAVGMTVLGIGLWGLRSTLSERARPGRADNVKRITVRAIAVVALVAICSGAVGFAAMRDSYEQSLAENMQLMASSSAATLGNTLDTSLWFPRTIATRPAVRESIAKLAANKNDAVTREFLIKVGESFMNAGISAIAFYSADGELLAASGEFVVDKAKSRQPLTVSGQKAQLLWNQTNVLRSENEVRDGERVVGRMVAEQRMPIFDKLLAEIRASSASTDILVCNLEQRDAYCAPTRFYPEPFRIPMYKGDGNVNLPINHALLGKAGVSVATDLRGVPVFAAYTPIRDYGLGVVVKSNVDTMYSPLKNKANALVVALLLLVAMGASMLLIQVRPLLAQLIREQRRTSVILENSNDAFVALGVDGRISDWNTEAERTFGWSAQEAIGRKLAELIIPPAQRQAHDAGFAQFTKTGTGPVVNKRVELSALCRDGREIPIEMSVAAFHNGQGFVATAFIRDISERQRLSGELITRASELEQERDRAQAANRAKSEFVANMSHELRTPMNAVLGMTYLLGHTELQAEQKKYLDMIRSSGQSLLGIMNDILDFSKVEAGRMELAESRFNLGDVLGAVATIMSVNAGDKDLELAIGVEPDVPQLLVGDSLRVQQILVNLVGNAIKFTEHGEVSLLVSLLRRDEERATLRMSVSDTGIGMDAAQRARLFSPFTQGDSSTTRRFGGTGLGLTISKHLAELMGGTISIDSEEGRGSRFDITLPLRVAQDQNDADRPGSALGHLRLLVVDDNATSRAYLAKTIAGWHWEADSASSGEEAIGMVVRAETSDKPYNVVLLDWHMPDMDGMATMRALRTVVPATKLPITLMVNAYGRGRLMEMPASSQVDAILSKPVTGSSLFDTLHELLVQRARAGHSPALYPALVTPALRLEGARLLLAEDNELNQAVARGILERVGARIDIVGNGELALARLAAAPLAYDLVLMDIQMPVLDGFAATRRIRKELGLTMPVLAMTAGVTESERAACLAAGMNGLIAKPIEVDDMLATITRHLPGARAAGGVNAGGAATPETVLLPVLRLGPLVDIAKGNPVHLAAVAQLVTRMVDDGTRQFAEAQQHFREGRNADAAKTLHTLRGGVGSVGAKRFAAASLVLEQALKGAGEGDPGMLFHQAARELDEAMTAARAWLEQNAVNQ